MNLSNRQRLRTAILTLVLVSAFLFQNLSVIVAQTTQTIPTTAIVNIDPRRVNKNQTVQITLKLLPLPPLANESFHNLQYIITKPDGTILSGGPFTTDQNAEYKFDFFNSTDIEGNYTIEFTYPGETFSNTNTTYTQSKITKIFTVQVFVQLPAALILFFSLLSSGVLAALVLLAFYFGLRELYKKRYSTKVPPEDPPGNFHFCDIIRESNFWPSLAKFQILLWTIVVLFSFCTISIARIFSGVSFWAPTFPENLLLLLGISAAVIPGSAIISKNKYGETPLKKEEEQASGNSIAKPTENAIGMFENLSKADMEKKRKERGFWSMLEEGGKPSVTRFQMFAWTWVGVLIYAGIFAAKLGTYLALGTGPESSGTVSELLVLPDVDFLLVALMGLSQGSYISGKAVAGKIATVFPGISPNPVIEGGKISISGVNLGTEGTVEIYGIKRDKSDPQKIEVMGTRTIDSTGVSWGDSSISIPIPNLKDLPKTAEKYKIRLFIGGKAYLVGGRDLEVKRAPATIESITDEAVPGQLAVITGNNFGSTKGEILMDGNPSISPVSWDDTRITFNVPPNCQPNDYSIRIHVREENSEPSKIKVVKPPAPDPPKIYQSVSPNPAVEGSDITIRGVNFGTVKGTVEIGGRTISKKDINWTDSEITVKLPKKNKFTDITNDKVKIKLIINNIEYPTLEDLKIEES